MEGFIEKFDIRSLEQGSFRFYGKQIAQNDKEI